MIGFRRISTRRAIWLASTALAATVAGTAAQAADATWLANPGSSEFNNPANWSPAAAPTGTASFGTSSITALSISAPGSPLQHVGGFTLNSGASAYSITNNTYLEINGGGIVINGGSLNINNPLYLNFSGGSTAGDATIVNSNSMQMLDTSTLGNANFTQTVGSINQFFNASSAGSATIANNGELQFWANSTGGTAAITNGPAGLVDLSNSIGTLSDNKFSIGSIGGGGTFALSGIELTAGGNNLSTDVSGVIADGGANGGIGASLVKVGTGTMILSGINTYTGGTTINNGTLQLGRAGGVGAILNTVTVGASGTFDVVNADTSGITSITNSGTTNFRNSTSAGSANITNDGTVMFFNNTTGGTAAITNGPAGLVDLSNSTGTLGDNKFSIGSIGGGGAFALGGIELTVGGNNLSAEVTGIIRDGGVNGGTGASLVKVGTGTMILSGISTYTGGTTINGGTLQLGSAGGVGAILNTVTVGASGTFDVVNADTSGITSISNSGATNFHNSTSAGSALITNDRGLNFNNTSSAGSATITNNGTTSFNDASAAGSATITNNNRLYFGGTSSVGSATITNNSELHFFSTATAATATIANNTPGGLLYFQNNSSAGSASITNDGQAISFQDSSTAGNATITNNRSLTFRNGSTAGSATIVNNNLTYFTATSSGGSARLIANGGSAIDFSNLTSAGTTAGSFEGNGTFSLGSKTLSVGGNGLSTTVSGIIADGGDGGGTGASLIKTGTGALTLSGTNFYTGATTVDAGALVVNGSITASSGVTVNSGGLLAGTGIVGATSIHSGGTLAAGSGTAGTSLTVSGSLALQSGASYMVQINPTSSSFTDVTGAATLGGATVKASYANGSYVARQYTILTAGSVSGTFGSLVDTNLPTNFHTTLSYDATHAYLNLILNFVPPGGGLSGNQNGVGNAIVGYFNTNGGIPLVYSGLTPAGLTQASGEAATVSQQTTFNAMTQFMGLMTDPFTPGRGPGANAPAYAEDDVAANGYASSGKPRSQNEREAYAAVYSKAPLRSDYDPRWSVWAAGFGGSQTTDGNLAAGSNTSTSRIFGMAAGADYIFSPNTIAGFALAGGGTNFNVVNGGSGRSDLFQAGAFLRHTVGAAYVSAALAYGWQDITTDRTVTIAGVDRLRAQFNANAYSGRLEGGYRFVMPWIGGVGLTPYAAGQFTSFDLPAYAETVVSGANTFALAYGSKSVTDTRSELGVRADKSWAMPNAVLTLRGRAAWAHDFNPDRAINSTFQALPGASFTVNGARQAGESALTTASIEMKWMNGWSAAGTFEGEFSNVTRSYAGKAVVRYAW